MYKQFGASKKLLLTRLRFQIHQPESRILICLTRHASASQKLTNSADFHPNENEIHYNRPHLLLQFISEDGIGLLPLTDHVVQILISKTKVLFFTYSQPYLYSIHRTICRPSDHSDPRLEPGTGGSSGKYTNHYTTAPHQKTNVTDLRNQFVGSEEEITVLIWIPHFILILIRGTKLGSN